VTEPGPPAFREICYDVAGGTATTTLHRQRRSPTRHDIVSRAIAAANILRAVGVMVAVW
jgi:hypothetical protein